MTNRKTTRRALFMSIISLMLCCAMLVGTTFAWFTDSVTSANNIIKSGNLDIELEYAVFNDDGTFKEWKDVKDQADILTNTLWEPGVTEIAYLRVANAGSLALKYQLGINIVSETAGVNQAGDEFKLSDYINFGVVEGIDGETNAYATREAAVAALTDAKALNAGYTKASSMTAGQELYLALVVYMPTTVDNVANHNGTNIPEINLGINVVATQLENEDDSFGKDYDEDAWVDGFDVYTEQDLNAAIANGETNIVLMDNIDLTAAIVIPAAATTYSARSSGVVINLNGKNITIASEYDENNATASSAVVNNGVLTLVGNGSIKATNNYTVRNYGTMIIDGVTIENGIMNFADLTVQSGNISNSRSGKHTIYGNNAKLTINGGVFYNGNPGNAAIFSYAGEVEINGGEFSIADGTATLGWTSCLLDAQENAKFTIKGGVVNGEIRDYNKNTTVYGGTFSHSSVKNFVASGYKAVESSGAWTVVPENAIATSDDLIAAINTAAAGDTLLLAPGEYSLRFTNNTAFNVDNLNIKGMDNAKLTVSSSEAWYGRVQGDNVTFENIHFTSSVGATGKATYKNCTFDNWTICASSGNKETYFNNCDIKGTLNTSTDFSSGNTYVTDSTVAKAEFSGAATMYFTNCQIGELISWDMATVLKNCVVEKQDLKMEDQKVTTIETDENGLSLATNNADPDALVLYEVPSDYAADTLVIPEGVTSIGNYAFSNNTNVKTVVLPSSVTDLGRGFDTSTVKKVVLNEGLETISSRAFKSTTALEEVVISSSVKEIADNAFQKSGIKEIVIPANVETIGETAFGSSKIEKVTIEGNTSIQGYAFRGCTNLREVYLNGDNVTFIASTLNGRNSTWFCNDESNNPNTSNITFYVVNKTVAARVKIAMGAEAANTTVYVNGVLYEG